MTPELSSEEVVEVVSHRQQNAFSRLFRRNKKEKLTSNATIRRLHLFWKKKARNGSDEEIKWLLSENACSTSSMSSVNLKEKRDENMQTKNKTKNKKKLYKRAGKLLVQTCRYISLGFTAPGIPPPHLIANYPAISYTKEIYPFDYASESDYYDYSTYNGYSTAPYSPSLFF